MRSSQKQLVEDILDSSSRKGEQRTQANTTVTNFSVFHIVLMGQICFSKSTINLNSWKQKTMGLNNDTSPINWNCFSICKKHYQRHKYSHFLNKKNKVCQIYFKIVFYKIMFQAPIVFWRKSSSEEGSRLDFTEVVLGIFLQSFIFHVIFFCCSQVATWEAFVWIL